LGGEAAGAHAPHWDGARLTPCIPMNIRYTPNMCYHTKFRRYRSNHFGDAGPRPLPLELGRGWPPRNTLLRHMLPYQILLFWVKPSGRA